MDPVSPMNIFAGLKLYRKKPTVAPAKAREIQARRGKIIAFAKVGKEITSEYDFSFLSSIQRTNSIIEKAFSDIEQNQNKVVHSLFWFTNLNPIDNTAIQHLITGNKEKAIEIWDKLTDEKEVTSKIFQLSTIWGRFIYWRIPKKKSNKELQLK